MVVSLKSLLLVNLALLLVTANVYVNQGSQAAMQADKSNYASGAASKAAQSEKAASKASNVQSSAVAKSNENNAASSSAEVDRSKNTVKISDYEHVKEDNYTYFSCKKLETLETIINQTMIKIEEFRHEEVKKDVSIVKKAISQLQNIMDQAQKNAAQSKILYDQKYNHQKASENVQKEVYAQGSNKATDNKYIKLFQMNCDYGDIYCLQQHDQLYLHTLSFIQKQNAYIDQLCNRYIKVFTYEVQQKCQNLKRISEDQNQINYCTQYKINIDKYKGNGYLSDAELCRAKQALSYLQNIYEGVNDILSGHREQYLQNNYKRVIARRETTCTYINKYNFEHTKKHSYEETAERESCKEGSKTIRLTHQYWEPHYGHGIASSIYGKNKIKILKKYSNTNFESCKNYCKNLKTCNSYGFDGYNCNLYPYKFEDAIGKDYLIQLSTVPFNYRMGQQINNILFFKTIVQTKTCVDSQRCPEKQVGIYSLVDNSVNRICGAPY